jgi:hypothetical protein
VSPPDPGQRRVEVTPDRKVRVHDADLLPAVVQRMMQPLRHPGDWIWDESTGKGWMRRADGKIAELSPQQVKVLQVAAERGGDRGAQRAIQIVLETVAK